MVDINQVTQQNISAPSAYTEYSFTWKGRVNELTLNLRSGIQPVYFYFAPSGSPNPGSPSNLPAIYGTIPAGASRTIRGILGSQTVYFQTPGTNQVLEVDSYA